MAAAEREVDLSDRMSEHEALMWNIEKDPWMNPSGASVVVVDKPVDMDLFRRYLRHGISKMPRMYQRVAPGFGRLSTPSWVPDHEFDLNYHLREIELPGPGSERQLLDLAAKLYEEPLDRTRPLWRFVSIRGLEGGKAALYTLTHHSIADGVGQMRMAELYQQISRDEEPPPEVDLEAIIAQAVADHGSAGGGKDGAGDLAASLLNTTTSTASHLLRRQVRLGRRLIGETMLWGSDPRRIPERVADVYETAKSATGMLSGGGREVPGGSPLWTNRSRHRHLEHVRVSLDELKAASKALGGSVNDGFMAALTEGAYRYHAKRDADVEAFNTSLVISTRSDNKIGGNSFTPVMVQVSGKEMTFAERIAELHRVSGEAKEEATRTGGMGGMAGLINLLPTSVVTSTARSQAAHIDFATSNLRGAPFTLYCAGAKVETIICMGPVAGTAANITAMSYDGNFEMGIFLDPKAIDDPEDYRRCVEEAFADLLLAGGE